MMKSGHIHSLAMHSIVNAVTKNKKTKQNKTKTKNKTKQNTSTHQKKFKSLWLHWLCVQIHQKPPFTSIV